MGEVTGSESVRTLVSAHAAERAAGDGRSPPPVVGRLWHPAGIRPLSPSVVDLP